MEIVHELCQKFGLLSSGRKLLDEKFTAHRLTGNLQRLGFEKVTKVEALQDIIEEMGEETGQARIPSHDENVT